MKNSPALIAFDLDGTLVNTEAVSLPDMIAYLNEEYNIPITAEHWRAHYHGSAAQGLLNKIEAEYGQKIELAPFMKRRFERLQQQFEKGIAPCPGMLQAVRQLHAAGQLMCVCTNSPPERVTLVLANTIGQHSAGINLAQIFSGKLYSSVSLSGQGKAKPAPDVYQNALNALKTRPGSSLAVEDSVIGVEAAVAADMPCWGYTGLSENQQESAKKLKKAGASFVFHHWDDFVPALKRFQPKP